MEFTLSNLKITNQNEDSRIVGIAWSQDYKKIAVVYDNENIDLFDDQGNFIENFQTKIEGKKTTQIGQIFINPQRTELAIVKSDNTLSKLRLGPNWMEKKIYSSLTFQEGAKYSCMMWSKTKMLLGLSNGDVVIFKEAIEVLHRHQKKLPCISISSSSEEDYIIFGHEDKTISIYDTKNKSNKEFTHSCMPNYLVWGEESRILIAGKESKVVQIYDNSVGNIIQKLDHSKDEDFYQFCCISETKGAIALGNFNSFYVYLYNEDTKMYKEFKNDININKFLLTYLCWKPDGTELITVDKGKTLNFFGVIIDKKQKKEKEKIETQEKEKTNKEIKVNYNKDISRYENKEESNDLLTKIQKAEYCEEIEKYLKLCGNPNMLLQYIIIDFEHIFKTYKKENKCLQIHSVMNSNDIKINSFMLFNQSHEIILKNEKEINIYFIKFERLIKELIKLFQNQDINNLFFIKNMIETHNKYDNELIEMSEINNAIKATFFKLIEKKSLNSSQIIHLIVIIGIEQFHPMEMEKIFNSINIYLLKEIDFSKLKNIWEEILNKKTLIYSLVDIIFKKVEILKDFGIIYKLMPVFIFDETITYKLEKKLRLLLNNIYNIKPCENILNDIYKALEIMVSIKCSVGNFLGFIEQKENINLSKKMVGELYLKAIKDSNLNKSKEIQYLAFKFFIDKNMVDEGIINVIISLKDKSLIQSFLDIIEKNKIVYKDFFETNTLNKFKLYKFLYEKLSKFHNCNYFKYSNNALIDIYKQITKLNLDYEDFKKLIEQMEKNEFDFQEKLNTFNILNKNNAKKILGELKKIKNDYYELRDKLLKLENFIKLFFHLENEIDSVNKQKSEMIKSKNLADSLKNLKDFFENSILYQNYKNYFILIDSQIFMSLFIRKKLSDKEENISQTDLFQKCLKEDFLILSILNNLNEDSDINNIPLKDIIIEVIRKIIKKCKTFEKNRKQKCLNIIKKELDIIDEINKVYNSPTININIENSKKNNNDNFIKEKNLVNLSYFDNVKNVICGLILLINIFKAKETEFNKELKEKNESYENSQSFSFKDINNLIHFLKTIEIDVIFFDINENNSFLVEFLNSIPKKEEELNFLIGKTNNEIRALSEFIGETENTIIQISDILDLTNVCNFMENIKKLKSDIQLFKGLKNAIEKNPSIINSFHNYFNIFKEIKHVYEEYVDKPEVFRNKIEKILENSKIDIDNDKETGLFKIKGIYTDISNNEQNFDYNDLQDLYERSLFLTDKAYESIANNLVENYEVKKKNSEIFVFLVENINQLKKDLFSLYIKGYPYNLSIKLEIKEGIASSNGDDIKDLLSSYRNSKNDLEDVQTLAYRKNSLIRLIYGRQFYDIYDYILNKYSKDNILSLLRKISNGKIKIIPNFNINPNYEFINNRGRFSYVINNINEFLEVCLKNNKIKLQDLYIENIILKKYNNKINNGIYIWNDDSQLDINIMKVYSYLTGNFPIPITVLLCTKETNEEEITSFIYRVILCEFKVLFIIINSDNLELSNAQYLLWILKNLYYRYKTEMKSTLLITFTDNYSILRNELWQFKDIKPFTPRNFVDNTIKNDYNYTDSIEVWSSDETGVGKSTQIKLKVKDKKENRNYLYFPIGGMISRKDIINLLLKLELNILNLNHNFLHIDIYDINEETLPIIREFLFCLLIIRNYSYEEKIFYLGHDVEIAIELPVGYSDVKENFVLLNYFKQKKITLKKLPALIDFENDENKNINAEEFFITDIQLVSNILIMLKNGEIEDNIFDLTEKHDIISLGECQEIINEFCKLENGGNYYQKNAFIHILADQFRKFCKCNYLEPQILINNDKYKSYQNSGNDILLKKNVINNNQINNHTQSFRNNTLIYKNNNMNNNNNITSIKTFNNFNNNQIYQQNNNNFNNNQMNLQNNNNFNNNQIYQQNNQNNFNNNQIYQQNNNNFNNNQINLQNYSGVEINMRNNNFNQINPQQNIINNIRNRDFFIIDNNLDNNNNSNLVFNNNPQNNNNNNKIVNNRINSFFNENNRSETFFQNTINNIPLNQNNNNMIMVNDKKNTFKITLIRKIMIENIIKLTSYFINRHFTEMKLNQNLIVKTIKQISSGQFNQKKINEIAKECLFKEKEVISFDKINPSLVFFNEDITTFSIITTQKEGDEEYNQLKRLYNTQIYNREEPLKDYMNMDHEDFIEEVRNILGLNPDVNIKSIIGSYCFTYDNFIKMILILLRIRAGIPVIMMGETGCGKTSLIKILSALLNKGTMNLKIMNIHAGIENQDIIDFIEKVNDEANSEPKEKNGDINMRSSKDKIWVFFDEINTCNSMGLFSEIFYNHSYYGKKLNNKLTFIASCNPYRLKSLKNLDIDENDFCLTSKDKNNSYYSKQNLVYLVNPLPHSLLTSVFNFGYLSNKDEKKYIKITVKETLKAYKVSESIENLFVEEIALCQNFMRENNDVSSVSLRELRRFNIIFTFFMNYLTQRKDNKSKNPLIECLCLSLHFCYYIRLSNNELRKEIKEKINQKFLVQNFFDDVTLREKKFLASKMKIPSGIAKNSTLLENIFSLFVCIINKIPIIMCGKPGKSKTLSFQIVYDNLKGERSENEFFKNYPEILVFSYQGSKTSTSEGVKKVFNRAKKYLKKRQEKIIPVVYFDEMGLAEESPHNPLKVIHSELEYDDNEQKVGFVGISNWKLDASKMNRTIFLGVPNLEENDLQETAKEIAQNLSEQIFSKYKDLFSNLVKTYWEYKNFIKSTSQSEFHGLRDFYHLIKNTMFYLKELDNGNIEEEINIMKKSYEIGIKSLFRNFDGLREPFNSFEKIKKIFDEFYPGMTSQKPNILDCLKDNIKDINSRFLLLIMESSMSLNLLRNIMNKLGKNYIFYNGSQLTEDLNQEKYNEKLLNKIQLYLENGDILVLRNMENIYPSLYNLFNQNFTFLGGKKFSKIAFANYNIFSAVHDDFRAIVLVDKKKIEEKMEDPPFLNRFEKHYFSFEYLMSKEELQIAGNITDFLNKILSFNNKECKIDLRKQTLWFNIEEIKGLVVKECYLYTKEKDNIIDYENNIMDNIFGIMAKLLSQDIFASLYINEGEIGIKNNIKKYYESNHINNVYELFEQPKNIIIKGKNTKLIIYTFSKILQPFIRDENPIKTPFGNINKEMIFEKIVKSVKYDSELNDIIRDYYESNNKKILIFKFDENDLDKINQIKFKINDIENEKNKILKRENKIQEKYIIFIIHLTRQKIEPKIKDIRNKGNTIYDLISNIDEEYNQFFIDNLSGKVESNIMKTLSKSPTNFLTQIFNQKNKYLKNIIKKIFSFLTYEFINTELDAQNYVGDIIQKILQNDLILELLMNKLSNELGKSIFNFIKEIFSKGVFEKNDIEFSDIIFNYIYDKVYLLIFKFILRTEREHFLNPILSNYDFIKKEKVLIQYIQKYIDNLDFNKINVVERINNNKILLFTNLLIPLSKTWYDIINSFIENFVKKDYLNNKDHIRSSSFENDRTIEEELNKYETKNKNYLTVIKGELLRIEELYTLFKNQNIKIIKALYKDFLTLYIKNKFNEKLELGLRFLDILIQLKLNINKYDDYAYFNNNKNSISSQNSLFYFQDNLFNNSEIITFQNIKYDEDTLSKILVFIISYKEDIYSLLEIFFILNNFLENFFENWKNLIMNKKIKYEIDDNVPKYKREINEAIFIIYESLIKSIFTYNKYNNMEESKFFEYLDSIKNIYNNAKQLYFKLYLPSKELYTLQILINFLTTYDSCKKKNRENNIKELFIAIINDIALENNFIINKDYKSVETNYNKLLSILDNIFKEDEKEYYLLLNNLFLSRYNKCLDNEYRKALTNIFFNNIKESQMKYIFPVFKRLINNIQPKYSEYKEICSNSFENFYLRKGDYEYDIIDIITGKNNNILNMNILYYFEFEFELYFRNIPKGKKLNHINNGLDLKKEFNNILKNSSIEYFKKAMNYYLNVEGDIIGKLYCLAYIKIYLKNASEFIKYDKNQNILDFSDIYKLLLPKNNSEIIKNKIYSLKIYFFKCVFKYSNKYFLDFLNSIANNNNLLSPILQHDAFIYKINKIFEQNNKHFYNFSFIDINDYEMYKNFSDIVDVSEGSIESHRNYKEIMNSNKVTLELIYNKFINKYAFDLLGNLIENNHNNIVRHNLNSNPFFNWMQRLNIDLQSKKLFEYLMNVYLFKQKVVPKLKLQNNIHLNEDLLYIIFFSVKYAITFQHYKKDTIFSIFYSKDNLPKALSYSFFPGDFPKNNEMIESYYEIENCLNSGLGVYLCSCGKYYTIQNCTFPSQISYCPNPMCRKTIGGSNHKLANRDNIRIILRWQYNDLIGKLNKHNISYIFLDDYKSQNIDPLLNRPSPGIGKMSKDIIYKTGSNIRNINELPFRIMNFIFYGHLLISNILEILNDNEISNYFSEETSCFDIMITNWKKIQELLSQIGMGDIKIFMNAIFNRVKNIVFKYKQNTINTQEGRNQFENDFNQQFSTNNLMKIKEEMKVYLNLNQEILNSSPTDLSSLIQQLYPIDFYKNMEKEPYIDFKYLYLNSYPSISDFITNISSNYNYKSKYPLTIKVMEYLEKDKKEISLLKYIPKINTKVNLLIDNYSYKISREEASKNTIKDEFNKAENNLYPVNILKNNENIEQYMKDFVGLFNNFKDKNLQWGCHRLKSMMIDSNSPLSCILLDDNDPGFYLASIYKKMIEYQNSFLDNLINFNSQNGLLHYFVNQLKSEIMIQDASFNDIIKIELSDNNKNNLKFYSSFEELIIINSSINPLNNKYRYEFDQIETELGNIILPGVRKFKSTDDGFRFIIYMFEGYRGKNSNILTNFNEKYPPKNLTAEEKSILRHFIYNFVQDDYKNCLFSIQILINYIQKLEKNEKNAINLIISNLPGHIYIDEKIKKFFEANNKIEINKLVRLFEFFEYLCWNQIKENLLDEYNKQLDEKKVKLIDDYYKKNTDDKNIIKKVELAGAVRKFISRYLAGKRGQSEYGGDKNLFAYLTRFDLWERNIDEYELEQEFSKLSSEVKITIGEAKNFYEKLGGDNEIFKEFFKEEEMKNVNNEIILGNERTDKNIIFMNKMNSNEEEEEIVDGKNQKEKQNDETIGDNNGKNFKKRKLY